MMKIEMNIEVKVKIDDDDNILSNFSEAKKIKNWSRN